MGAAWERFLFAPRSVAPLVLIRIAYGMLLAVWTLSLAPDLVAFFSSSGLYASAPDLPNGAWTLFALSDARVTIFVAWVLLLAAAVALVVGWRPRVAAIAAFVLVTSLERRNPGVFNAGDGLVRILALYLALCPTAAPPFGPWPTRAPWGLRLMQIQLSVIYVASVAEKLQGNSWPGGTALGYALRLEDLQALDVAHLIANVPALTAALTIGTLVMEASLAVCPWIPRLRKPVLLAGLAFHIAIYLSLRVGFFSAAMLTLYLAFVPPEAAERFLLDLRARLGPLRSRARAFSLR
jgi:hypothetical protein